MRALLLTLAYLTASGVLLAEPSGPERAKIQAAIIVLTFDRLEAGCGAGGGYTQAQQQQVSAWTAGNAVQQVRALLPTLQRNAALFQQLEKSAQQIVQMARGKGASDCAAAASLAQLPDAQFGQLGFDKSSTAQASTPPKPAGLPMLPQPTPVSAELVASIDSFAFATRPKMGMGGFIALDIYPVVLFKTGELLNDVKGLRYAGGLAAHRAAHADEWTRWRRVGGKVQRQEDGKWENLPFDNTYASLPLSLRLAGRFRSTSGVGNVAVGGTQSVTVVDEYRFERDGSVLRTGAVGSQATAGDTTVATSGGPRERRGRYRIDGLLLRIDYDDGAGEQRILIADPKDPRGSIWLDGEAYVERR